MYVYDVVAVNADNDTLTYSLVESPPGMSIHPETGQISWIPGIGQPNDVVEVTVRAADGHGGVNDQTFLLEIFERRIGEIRGMAFDDLDGDGQRDSEESGLGGRVIYLDENNNARRELGELYSTTDDNGDYAFIGLSPGTYIIREEAQSGWEQTTPDDGYYRLTLGENQSITDAVFGTQFVGDPSVNDAPHFTSLPPTETTVGELFRYGAVATDPNHDPLSFDLLVKPEGMGIDSVTGIVVWRPGVESIGTHDVMIRVRDGRSGFELQSFQVTVRQHVPGDHLNTRRGGGYPVAVAVPDPCPGCGKRCAGVSLGAGPCRHDD